MLSVSRSAARAVAVVLSIAIASATVAGPVMAATPPNDNLADAQVLSGAFPISVTASNDGATSEAGEPSHGAGSAASVWWRWTATLNGPITVSACGSSFDTLLAVYTGTTFADMTQVAQSDDACNQQSEVILTVASGTTYLVAVDGFGGSTGDISLSLDALVVPPNDSFATPEVLAAELPISVTGTNVNATREAGEPEHGSPGYLGTASVWYTWTPAASGAVTIDLCDGSDFATLLSVYTGESLGALVQVGGNVYGCGPFSRLTLNAVAGTTYRIAIDGGFGDTGTLTLAIRPATAVNDNFADATVLSGPLPILAYGTNVGATNEGGEPTHADPDPSATRFANDSSVWYRWTATTNGPVTIDTCGSEFNSLLGVYEGAGLADLTRVGWNSNACSNQSLVRLDAVAGRTYQIAVVTADFEGPITLAVRVAGPPPPNDSFAGARQLRAALPVGVNDSNYEATSQAGEPIHAGVPTSASVWYQWTPSRSGPVVIDTCASDGFKVLAVYTGSRVDALAEVAATYGPTAYLCAGYGSIVRFSAVARTTYSIAVEGDRGSIGLSLRHASPPANDAFSAATILAGQLPITATATNVDASYEPSEPSDYTGTGRGASVWWSWTPAASGIVAVETCDLEERSVVSSLIGIWTGASLDALDQAPDQVVNSCRYGTSITLPVVAGESYHVAVDSVYYPSVPGNGPRLPLEMEGTVPLTIRTVQPPRNDGLDDRQVLTGSLPLTITATNLDATGEPAEPGHDFLSLLDSAMRSVWYEWTATSTGRVIIESCDNPTDVVVGLYEGPGLGELTDLEGFELQTCPAGYRHPLEAIAGSTYLIAVDGVGGDHGPFSLTIRDAGPPANDLVANAQLLSGALPIVAAGSTVDASVEAGEPDHSGPPTEAWVAVHSTWYRWTPGADERVVIDTCPTAVNTRLVVFAGAAPQSATEVGHNEDACGVGSAVDLMAIGGTTYWIKVDGRDTGSVTVRVRRHAPPVNDAFARARDLGRKSHVDATSARLDATAEPEEPRHGGTGAGQSIWFRWTAPSGGTVTIDTCGSEIHSMLSVYTGAEVGALTVTASGADWGCGLWGASRVTFAVTAGTTYRIAVDSATRADPPLLSGGPVQLHLQLEAGSGTGGSRP